MDLWEILGLLGVLALWAALGLVSWFAGIVTTRGRLPWGTLPVVLVVALAGALLVPALGLKGWGGLWTSMASALLLPAAALLLISSRSQGRADA
jgi:hypothetical protein